LIYYALGAWVIVRSVSFLLCRSMWFDGFACLLGVGETLFF